MKRQMVTIGQYDSQPKEGNNLQGRIREIALYEPHCSVVPKSSAVLQILCQTREYIA